MTLSLSQLTGFRVGHWTDLDAGTGGAPGTREIALLSPACLGERAHAVLLRPSGAE